MKISWSRAPLKSPEKPFMPGLGEGSSTLERAVALLLLSRYLWLLRCRMIKGQGVTQSYQEGGPLWDLVATMQPQ